MAHLLLSLRGDGFAPADLGDTLHIDLGTDRKKSPEGFFGGKPKRPCQLRGEPVDHRLEGPNCDCTIFSTWNSKGSDAYGPGRNLSDAAYPAPAFTSLTGFRKSKMLTGWWSWADR